ncbi:uncharacterized protein METZ01_LOCUS354935, partial [marine metagenome]
MKSSSVSQWARLLVAAFFTFSLNGFAQVLFEDDFN